jgi:hypothetical protein
MMKTLFLFLSGFLFSGCILSGLNTPNLKDLDEASKTNCVWSDIDFGVPPPAGRAKARITPRDKDGNCPAVPPVLNFAP